MIAIDGNTRPWNIHGRWIEDGNGADGAGSTQRFPALSGGLIMRGEGGGDIRGRASQIDGDFPLEVEAGQLIEILFRNFQSVADENQRDGNIGRSAGGAGADEGVVR